MGLVDVDATEIGAPDLMLFLLITLAFAAVVLRPSTQRRIQRTVRWAPVMADALVADADMVVGQAVGVSIT